MKKRTVHPAIWQDTHSVGLVGELPTGVPHASVDASCERQHSLICAFGPWQLLEDGALLFLLRDRSYPGFQKKSWTEPALSLNDLKREQGKLTCIMNL